MSALSLPISLRQDLAGYADESAERELRGSLLSYWLIYLAAATLYLDSFVPLTTVNFNLSDVFAIFSLLALLPVAATRRAFLAESFRHPILRAFAALTAVWGMSLLVNSSQVVLDLRSWYIGLLELLFVFFVLAPLIFYHARFPARHRQLWRLQWIMIAVAGVLSITDYLGITHFVDQLYFRLMNPMLRLNQPYLFGLVTGFLLLGISRELPRPRAFYYMALWALGFASVVLEANRAGLLLTFLSIVAVVWSLRRRLLRSLQAYFALAILLTGIGWGGYHIAFSSGSAFSTRAANAESSGAGFWNGNGRDEIDAAAWSDIVSDPTWFGHGIAQFRDWHPEVVDDIHNVPLEAAYQSGFLGLVAWICVWAWFWKMPRRQYAAALRAGDDESAAHWWCCCLAIAFYYIICQVYPLSYSRLDWVLPLLAAGPARVWNYGARVRPAVAMQHRAAIAGAL